MNQNYTPSEINFLALSSLQESLGIGSVEKVYLRSWLLLHFPLQDSAIFVVYKCEYDKKD